MTNTRLPGLAPLTHCDYLSCSLLMPKAVNVYKCSVVRLVNGCKYSYHQSSYQSTVNSPASSRPTFNEDVSNVVVEWQSTHDSVDGSLALLNYAVQHSSPRIRQQATHALKERPLHNYVPQLLNMLSSRVFVMAVQSYNRNGSLAGYQQAFVQEESDQTNVLAIADSIYSFVVVRPLAYEYSTCSIRSLSASNSVSTWLCLLSSKSKNSAPCGSVAQEFDTSKVIAPKVYRQVLLGTSRWEGRHESWAVLTKRQVVAYMLDALPPRTEMWYSRLLFGAKE